MAVICSTAAVIRWGAIMGSVMIKQLLKAVAYAVDGSRLIVLLVNRGQAARIARNPVPRLIQSCTIMMSGMIQVSEVNH